MKLMHSKLGILLVVGVVFLAGCSNADVEDRNPSGQKPVQGEPPVTIEQPVAEPVEETTANPASGTSLPVDDPNARAMQFDRLIEGIVSITLKDIEGNTVDRAFSSDEIAAIETAFNESYIMDTAYIEMITGYTMTIALENGEEVFITSYGDEGFIVARVGDGETYHLGCEVIGKILLEGNK